MTRKIQHPFFLPWLHLSVLFSLLKYSVLFALLLSPPCHYVFNCPYRLGSPSYFYFFFIYSTNSYCASFRHAFSCICCLVLCWPGGEGGIGRVFIFILLQAMLLCVWGLWPLQSFALKGVMRKGKQWARIIRISSQNQKHFI